jgi:hypothetical protein
MKYVWPLHRQSDKQRIDKLKEKMNASVTHVR